MVSLSADIDRLASLRPVLYGHLPAGSAGIREHGQQRLPFPSITGF
jgi:hypothetical protein